MYIICDQISILGIWLMIQYILNCMCISYAVVQ